MQNSMSGKLPDIKPQTKVAALQRDKYANLDIAFPIDEVSIAVGMTPSFIRRVCGNKQHLSPREVILLLDQDSFKETLVPRSMVFDYLVGRERAYHSGNQVNLDSNLSLLHGHVIEQLNSVPSKSVQCVVTSTPYWGMRIYKDSKFVRWTDGEVNPYGHEQTPEGFIRHTTEVLLAIWRVLSDTGSVWWNCMDTFNTRTQIRSSAAEALKAMQGKDRRSWQEHECRRYSAGHVYLKDGEQCLIPLMIAERASRIGYYVKSVITWAKTSTLPEPQNSRVSRNLEYVLHLSKVRTPLFQKEAYRKLPAALGGRNNGWETDKLSDVWTLPTSSGGNGHGAQFPVALPGRCIALSSRPEDIVLDPFVGAGNSGVAARAMGRRFIGIDSSEEYLNIARHRISEAEITPLKPLTEQIVQSPSLDSLL